MNSELARQPNPVEQARNLLRIVFKHEQARDPRGSDAGTLERMLGHLHNIEKSVTASMEDHVNASKRLRDFAETLERMKERLTTAPHQEQVSQINALITSLRKASTELGASGAPPAWASSVPRRPAT
jgi:soluble cytochrome b562